MLDPGLRLAPSGLPDIVNIGMEVSALPLRQDCTPCYTLPKLRDAGEEKILDKRIRVFLIVCASAFGSSLIIQTIFQKMVAGDMSTWGSNPGWQREIALWNVGCAIVSLASLKLKSSSAAIPVVLGFTVLFLCLGTNHLFALFSDPVSKFHWPPFIANYVGLFFGAKTLIQFQMGKLKDPA